MTTPTLTFTLDVVTEQANAKLNAFFSRLKSEMKQQDYAAQRKAIEQDALLTNAQRNQQLRSQNAADLKDVGSQMARNLATKPQNEEQALQLLEQRKELQEQLNNLLLEQRKLQQESGTSFSQSFGAMFAKMQSQAAITFNSLADTFESVFNKASDSVSHGITQWIVGTKTWSQMLREVGTSVLTELVQAVVQMAVRWIATQVMMAVAGKAILAAATASSTPLAAASAAIWATPAALATIATYGAAALSAPGFVAQAQALTMASALGSFAEGGFTGAGARDEVAGVVHRGEFVVPAERVNDLGLGFFKDLNSGRFSAAGANSIAGSRFDSQPGPGGSTIQHRTELNVAVMDGEASARKWAEGNDGETWFVSMMNKHAYKYQPT